MAISIAPTRLRPKSQMFSFFSLRTPGGLLFLCSVIVLGLSLVSWVALKGYQTKLNRDMVKIESDISDLKAQRPTGAEAEMLSKIARFSNIKNLLGKHRTAGGALTFLEQYVQPSVRFLDFAMDFDRRVMSVTAEGNTYDSLAKQMVAFEKNEDVLRVVLSEVSVDTEGQRSRGRFVIYFTPEAFVAKSN